MEKICVHSSIYRINLIASGQNTKLITHHVERIYKEETEIGYRSIFQFFVFFEHSQHVLLYMTVYCFFFLNQGLVYIYVFNPYLCFISIFSYFPLPSLNYIPAIVYRSVFSIFEKGRNF